MSALLLDTEALIWWDANDPRLGGNARAAIQDASEVYVSSASAWEIVPGLVLRTCPAEHLIVYKLVAARTHDIGDMESIVRRQVGHLDIESIRRWGREFAELKEDPDLLRPFERALRDTISGR